MKTFGVHSIKFRVIVIFSVITTLLVILMARLAYISARNIYLRQLEEQTTRLSRIAAEQTDLRFLNFIEPGMRSPGIASYQSRLRQTAVRLGLSDIFIFNLQGQVLINTSQLTDARAGLQIHLKEIRKLQPHKSFHSLPFKGKDGQWYFWNYLRLNRNYFLGVRERSARLSELDSLARLFWGIGILGVFLVVLSGWFIGRSIARPIDKLIAFSAEIGNGNMESRPPESVRGELTLLKDALLKMRSDLNAHEREKEEMLAQIAHELRNPLGGIALLAGLIKEDSSVNDTNKAYAETIARETEGLKHQISAYLHYSHPPQARPKPIDLQVFLNDIRKEFELRPEASHIHLNITVQNQFIEFDPSHLQQIIRNLLENSVNACGSKGTIEIRTSGQEIAVHDNGPGIPEDVIDKIFDPFFTTNPDGTGLGLAICRRLCRENNAELLAVNNPDTGCNFIIKKQTSG